MSDNYHNLLAKAAQLYEKHGIGRPEPFNVFSSLQNKNGHLHEKLHSRFLCVLLDYRKPRDETRENLKDFLQHVGVKDFELCDVKVELECDGIDILITNADKKAVVIENKSNPNRGDEDKQLWRYYNTLKKDQGYSDIHLLYLTPDGHDPSDNSVGNLDRKLIKRISYEDIIPWLERCQKRACGEPALRESVTQYLQLVRRLTGTDFWGKYMRDLKKLCLEDNNFVLVYDLNDVMPEAIREAIWSEIKDELRSEDLDLVSEGEDGLSYKLNEVSRIHVGAHDRDGRIWFGVYCSEKDHKRKYDKIKKSLESFLSGGEPDLDKEKMYPWWRYAATGYVDTYLNLKNPTREDLEILSNKNKRKKVVRKVAQGLQELLEVIEDIAMVNAIEEGAKTGLASREQVFKILRGQE